MSSYSVNRTSQEQRVRVVVDLPAALVEALDSWGVSSGKPSRRATTEQLLNEALRAKSLGIKSAAETEVGSGG